MMKGISADQGFKPGGSFLKQLLKDSYTSAKATEPWPTTNQWQHLISIKGRAIVKCASSKAVTCKYCLLQFQQVLSALLPIVSVFSDEELWAELKAFC